MTIDYLLKDASATTVGRILPPAVRYWMAVLLESRSSAVPPEVRKVLKTQGLLTSAVGVLALNAKGRWWARALDEAKAARWSEAKSWNWGP